MHMFLRPSQIDVDPESADTEDKRIMWHCNFEAFCAAINPDLNPDKLALLLAHISCELLKIIKSATTYATAISLLKARFVKQKREILLESLSLDLSPAVKQARALEMAQLHSASYASETNTTVAALIDEQAKPEMDPNNFVIEMSDSLNPSEFAAAVSCQRCFFCGGSLYPRTHCPAKKASCSNCQKVGHYARVCKSQRKQWNNNGESTNSNLKAGIVLDNNPQSIPASITGAAVAAASPALPSVYRTVLPVELNRG
ncbi:uncharacterized protein [Palaemon carinicauda]|uniref:uncharacterized protein n=1 Tax=Palaemon carinicauda TaxID=392227 RepID=UPI0035B62F45